MHIGPLVVSKQSFQPCWACNSQEIPWNSVLQVAVSLQELGECAICLGIPQNPWITLCKHIFCLECLVEHCANSDHPSSAKCPLCLVGLLSREARPVFLFADPLAFIPESSLLSVKLELMILKPMVGLGEDDDNSFLALPAWMHQIDLGLSQFEVHSPLMPFCQTVWISQQEALEFLNAEVDDRLSPRVKTFLTSAKKRILEEEKITALKLLKVQKMNFEMQENEVKKSEKEDSHVCCSSNDESINNPRKLKFFYWARAHGGDFFTLHPKAFKQLLLSSHDHRSSLAPQISAFPMRENSSNCSSLVEAAENPESLLRKWPPFKHLSCHLPVGSKVIWCDLQQQQQQQQQQKQEPKEEYNGQDEYCCSNTSTILEEHQNLYEMLEGWNGQRRVQAVVNLQDEREFPSL